MTTTSARTQNYVVAPEEITMLPLLNPPAGDGRTPEEFTFDLITSGEYYAVAAELDAPAPVTTPERRREIFRAFDQVFGLSDAEDEPPTLEIERCKFNEEGEPYNEPWVSFTYGEASIDIGDKGNGNLCAYDQMINFHDFGPLRDLAALLGHPTVAAALALQAPMPAEDPRIEIAREADSLLAELKGWVDEHTAEEPTIEEYDAGYYAGILITPGAQARDAGDTSLCHVPVLAIQEGIPTIQTLGSGRRAISPPQQVYEIVRLSRRGLVVLDAEHGTFMMTAAEFAEQTGDANAEGNERAADIATLPIDDRVFAAMITSQLDRTPETHRAMAQAGMILLAAASDGVGPGDGDADEETATAARIYRAAYEQGFQEALDSIKGFLRLRKNAPEMAAALVSKAA